MMCYVKHCRLLVRAKSSGLAKFCSGLKWLHCKHVFSIGIATLAYIRYQLYTHFIKRL